ncbi:MAG: XRE family transcriptional regulator [Methanomassiliicoccaceae archaeon]|nr:XRE family transcriptional regulator [Methanomassiliicoccaceae archaeon]
MTATDKLGKRVRTYREKLGLTAEELSTNAGLSLSLINDIENGTTYPPIGSMIKLSRALGQRVGTFMDDQFVKDPLIVRHDARKEETSSHRGAGGHYHYFPLGKGKTDRHMEPLYIVIEEGESEELSSHEGEEFVIVVSGEVKLVYGKEVHTLKAGDTVYYNSLVPHFLGSAGGPAEIFAIIYAPV